MKCSHETAKRYGDCACNKEESPAPMHAFEVRIAIGGETWDYVMRQLKDLLYDSEKRTPGSFQGFGGGGGGCYSVTTALRDISPEDYRAELEKWRENLPNRFEHA